MSEVVITKSNRKDKKMQAIIDGKKTVHFGQKNASDYTIHNDPERKERYIKRHNPRENWGKDGLKTAGFYSRWLLWNKKTLEGSVADLNKKFKSVSFKLQ